MHQIDFGKEPGSFDTEEDKNQEKDGYSSDQSIIGIGLSSFRIDVVGFCQE